MQEDSQKIGGSTVYENCLLPLLKAMHWRGSLRAVKESMPHFSKITSMTQFNYVMNHINFSSVKMTIAIEDFDDRLMPCLMVTREGDVLILLQREGALVKVFDGLANQYSVIDLNSLLSASKKVHLHVYRLKKSDSKIKITKNWFKDILKENKSLIYSALFLSLILNLLVLSAPLFIMSVYDSVIGASSYFMLSEFSAGVVLALIGIYIVYRLRAEHLALLGARFDKEIGNKIVSQLLYLAPSYTESATAGAQVARVKDFDRLREAVAGPMLTVFFDLPFIIITLTIIGILGEILILIPFVMIMVYVIISIVLAVKIKYRIQETSQTFADLQEFMIESINNIRVVKYTASVKKWEERYRESSAKASLSSIRFSMYNAANVAVSEAIMIFSGMMVLTFGAISSMNENLQIGALLAMMILIWRVLTPIRSIFNTLPKMLQLFNSAKQIDRLLDITPESEKIARVKKRKVSFDGDVTFKSVSMRYPVAYTPSLINVTFAVKRGEFTAIVGRNGSGKSTILKVLLGLYKPQAGAVLIDNQDIRQLNSLDLRNSIGYMPQQPELFFGTISANLRLGDPTAPEEQLRIAANKAGILEDIIALPEGFETKLTDQTAHTLAGSFRQCLCLARAYLRNSTILLLDEPGNSLDRDADEKLMEYVESVKGRVSIFMVTHRPSHLKAADRIILMEQGQVALQGTPDKILDKIPREYL